MLPGCYPPRLVMDKQMNAASLSRGQDRVNGGGAEQPNGEEEPGGGTLLLTVAQAAAQLAVSTATVYSLCERGVLAHVRILNAVRIPEQALARFLCSTR